MEGWGKYLDGSFGWLVDGPNPGFGSGVRFQGLGFEVVHGVGVLV